MFHALTAACIALTQDITPINPEMQNFHWSSEEMGIWKKEIDAMFLFIYFFIYGGSG